ncbi:unnamed protein product [Wickerhamomyces anomalus]
MSKFYELAPADKSGEPFPFKQLEGKVVIIVNVASKCGFTPQYKELEELYKDYKDQVLKKIEVNGVNADPVYNYLKNEKAGLLGFRGIKWNFEKFIIDKKGQVYERYSSLTKPSSLKETVEKLLKD